jgi:Na+-translocating ferredoxin:NAD+ oxidoreductase RnfD subunit
MNKFVIPEELESEVELIKGLYLPDILFIGAWYIVTEPFKSFVDPRINLVYTVFNVILAFILTRKSASNHGKRIYEEWLMFFLRDKAVYHMTEDKEDAV